ncbi:MAG: transglutaminase-like domain-containing protein [Chloroflexota bacterium]|nr:transglutaminase-like domain-containing protein [Chloroflexota bacterium]
MKPKLSFSRSNTPARTSRWWDLPAACLLLAALSAAAARLIVTEWTEHLHIVQTLTFLGALAGLALGQSIFPPRRVTAFALVYGLFAVPWQLGLTLARISENALWTDRLINLVSRLSIAIGQLVRQEPVDDPLFFLFCMAVLFWILSVHAGYALTRHARPWRAVLPSGLTLLVIHTYNSILVSRVWFLAAYLFFALLLLARLIYLRHRARWQRDHVFLSSYVGLDITRVTLQITVLLVLVAWTVPALATSISAAQNAWEHVTGPWITIRDRLDNAVASLRDQVGGIYNIYGEDLVLGRGSELTDEILLAIETQPTSLMGIRYYWRARVYDYYSDGQWDTTIISTTQFVTPGSFELIFPEIEEQRTAVFTVTTAVPISTLYAPGQPVWVNHAARADLAYNPDGTTDVVALHANPPLRAGETYRVRSSLNTVTVAQLRSAGTDYPSWVTNRYLQLPPNITPRVYELAHHLASDLDNPYDIASAITAYLREQIQYSETISSRRPSNQESLDWFLFDLREGHCNYYASAEVVLLRSLGIPARLAVGFAEGERQSGGDVYVASQYNTYTWPEDSTIYVVRRHNAHAWPEVYFPGLGWVEFEPTASQSPLHRPLGEDQSGIALDSPGFLDSEDDLPDPWRDPVEELLIPGRGSAPVPLEASDSGPTVALWLLLPALGLILIAILWRKRHPRDLPPFPVLLKRGLRRFDLQTPVILHRWVLRVTLPLLARAYMELNYALIRLGASPDPADTPAERAMALSRLLPEAAVHAQRLLDEYHTMAYSPHSGNPYVAQQAGHSIRGLSWRAAIRRLIARE